MSSVDVREIPEYSTAAIRKLLLGHPHAAERTVDDARAHTVVELRPPGGAISIELEPEGDPCPYWCGSMLSADCAFSDLLGVWARLIMHFPGTWLHNDACTMWSPAAFVADVISPVLQHAFESGESDVRDAASSV